MLSTLFRTASKKCLKCLCFEAGNGGGFVDLLVKQAYDEKATCQ